MKIGITSPYFDSMSGGERYMLTIAEYLSRNNRVDIFWEDTYIKELARDKLSIDLTRTNIVPNVFARKINVFKKMRITKSYDLIIVLSDGSIPISAAKKNILHFQRPFPSIKKQSITNRLKLKQYQSVIVNSKFTKKWIDKTYNVSSTVLYPPVATDEFFPEKKERLIFSVGRFHPFKKQDVLISVFSALHSVLPKWKLILAGGLQEQDKPYFNKLGKLIGKLPISLVPNATFERIKNYYGRARLYWHGAGYGENENQLPEAMEHFGITTVEAMSAGCISIVYNGGGQKEIVKDGKTGFLWDSEKELVQKTIRIIKNPRRMKIVKRKAILKSRDYDVESFYRKLDNIIASL